MSDRIFASKPVRNCIPSAPLLQRQIAALEKKFLSEDCIKEQMYNRRRAEREKKTTSPENHGNNGNPPHPSHPFHFERERKKGNA